MIFGSLDERSRQAEIYYAQQSAKKLGDEFRQQAAAAERHRLFGWPGILRTIGLGVIGLFILIVGGGHVVGCW